MPFCEACARHWTPPSMNPDGTCPTCGVLLVKPRPEVDAGAEPEPDEDEERAKVPWHFTLLLVALVLYLGYRAYQGIAWLVIHVG